MCGSGNNAGDGYALALCLDEAGISCTVFCLYDRFSGDGRYYYDKCRETGIPIRRFAEMSSSGSSVDLGESGAPEGMSEADRSGGLKGFNTIVDCLLGTGFAGEVRPELKDTIETINNAGAYTVSVDINSGLNGDTGMAETCVKSDLTVSVGGFKPGHFLNMAKDVMASKVNIDIGIEPVDEPYKLLEASDIIGFLGERKNLSNKGTYGYIALIGGSTRYSGAIRLAYLANAAMRSGAGVVKVALPSSIVHDVAPHILESTLFPLTDTAGTVAYVPEEIDELISNVKTVAFGMGIGTGDGAKAILEHLLDKFGGTLIIDADGLNILAGFDRERIRKSVCDILLTPHIKEFSRLIGLPVEKIQDDPIGAAKDYAKDTNTTVLLKGPATVVTDGTRIFITDRGCAGMATAGSGDVLSGIAAAVCAYGRKETSSGYEKDNCLAAAVSAYINGAAGELAQERFGSISMTASDTVLCIPESIQEIKK